MLLSVVVCTHNRAALLDRLLESLCMQSMSVNEFEVVIVDNASCDNTQEVIKKYASLQPNLRGIFESQVGLSHARNRGWREGRGKYIGYIDDDAKASENWLKIAEEVIQRSSPDLFGGPYTAFYDQPKPDWYKDEYGSFELGDRPFQLTSTKNFLSGCNLFVRRELLETICGFNSELGMRGKAFGYGEETDFMLRLWDQVPQAVIVYEPRLLIYHQVRPVEWSLMNQIKIHFEKGRFQYLTFKVANEPLNSRHMLGFIGLPVRIAVKTVFGTFFRDRKRYGYPENYLFECVFRDIQLWGKLFERFRQKVRLVL